MATFYHVAPANYQIGDDLMCFRLLEERGYQPVWKWEDAESGFDGDVVCLFRGDQLDEAQEFLEVFQPDGQLLRITIPDEDDGTAEYEDIRFTRVSEGYTAIRWCVPARYVEAM